MKQTISKRLEYRNICLLLLSVISICSGQRAHSCSLTRLYTVGWPTSNSRLDFPKIENGQFQNSKWIIPFKIFSRLRVKNLYLNTLIPVTYLSIFNYSYSLKNLLNIYKLLYLKYMLKTDEFNEPLVLAIINSALNSIIIYILLHGAIYNWPIRINIMLILFAY